MTLSELMVKKLEQGREYRNLSLEARALENDEKNYIVEGYATTFDAPYVLYKDDDFELREVVTSSAFDNCDMSDVIFQYNHEGRVFARTRNNTLGLECDSHGLKVVADLGGTENGRNLADEIRGGYTDRMSFGFIVSEDEIEETSEGLYTRYIRGISKLFDVSAVSIPANDMTSISCRDVVNGVKDIIKAERRKSQELEIAKAKAKAKTKEWRF